MTISLGELVNRFGGRLRGDAAVRVRRVASLATAAEGDISFLISPSFRKYLEGTRATAVILPARFADACPVNAWIADDPHLTYARVASLLHPEPVPPPGVHPSVLLGTGVVLDPGVAIGPHVAVGARVRIGSDVVIGPGCAIGDDVTIGAGTRLAPNVTIQHDVRIGERVRVHSGAVIGGDGFGFVNDGGVWVRVPQLGRVIIGNDVEVGANTTIDRGALGDTVIGDGVKLDNQVQIAHNVRIGEHTAIAGCTGIAGSTTIGRRCAIGGGVGISGHLDIADDVHITGTTFVSQSIPRKGVYSSGTPFEPVAAWRRNFIRMRQLDDMARRLQRLEQAMHADSRNKEQGQGK